MNKFYDDLISELTSDLGEDATRADWDEFHAEISYIRSQANKVGYAGMTDDEISDEARAIYDQIAGSRADLPSVLAFITAEIEEAA